MYFCCVKPVINTTLSDTHYFVHIIFYKHMILAVSLSVCLFILLCLSCIFDCTQAPDTLCEILPFLFSVLLSQDSMLEDKDADKGALYNPRCLVSVWWWVETDTSSPFQCYQGLERFNLTKPFIFESNWMHTWSGQSSSALVATQSKFTTHARNLVIYSMLSSVCASQV